jgi:type III pantothenate kinase
MILLIDIGNSRLKWALSDGQSISAVTAIDHAGDPTAAIKILTATKVATVWIAHVMGADHELQILDAVQARFGLHAQFARTRAEYLGLKCAYTEPSRLGVDRWLMLLAAWSEVRGPCCVVSAGTALTFDAVTADGQHQGGFIAPGLTPMLKTTLGSTRFATHDIGAAYTDGLGRDTEACVRQGAFLAGLGAIQEGVRAAGAPDVRFICGGDAAAFLPHLGVDWQRRDELVLQGLLALALQSA